MNRPAARARRRAAPLALLALSALLLPAREFHVAPEGDDAGTGTSASPWRTWSRSLAAVREARRLAPAEPVTVWFRGGVYPAETVVLDATVSGTADAPVRFAAAPGEEPVFTGAVRLSDWRPLQERPPQLPASAAAHVLVCDLRAAGVADFGDPTALGLRPELFHDGRLQTLARWPDTGFTQAGQARGATPVGPNWANFTGTMEGVFEYRDDRQSRWAEESDPRLGGYWFWDWSEEFLRLGSVDPARRELRTATQHQYGYRDGLRYFGLNLLCELDQPGEWYLDRESGRLYWYPVTAPGPDSVVTLSVAAPPFLVTLDGCAFVILQGLTWEEARGSGIRIKDGNDCRIEGCRLRRFGRDGIHVDGGFRHTVSGCWLEDLGCGGIRLVGGDRRTLTPADHVVAHTVVRTFSRFKRTYEPAVYVAGCGFRLAHNLFTRSSSSAMRLDGNDIVVEFNRIAQVVEESDDQGGIDCWYDPSFQGIVVRHNHWVDIVGGTHAGAAAVRLDDMISGVAIHGNVFERCGARMFGAVQINGGKENVVENNLFVECPAAVSFAMPWTEEKWFSHLDGEVIRRKIHVDVDIRAEPYRSRYPVLQRLRQDIHVNTVRRNLLVDVGEVLRHADARHRAEETVVVAREGRTLEEVCDPAFLRSHGLDPIPLGRMGPQENPWLRP